jgi:hypothetical protein
LRRGVGNHAINADRREQQAQSRERAYEKERVTPRISSTLLISCTGSLGRIP